ncbi:MAG: S1/P1 nuclease [Allosphingosinicella sp.]|uniref:S1/P1 nuclease n=1 Tax=Allosphingosinicella sp. TaxID=2823234 RepID=UPI00394081B2
MIKIVRVRLAKPLLKLSFLGALLAFSTPAAAWWEYGHETVARIALEEASPAARAEVRRMLRQGALLDTPTCPIATVGQAAEWADCVRAMGDRFSYTAPWHYQNVNVCRPFDQSSACANGNCVSAQVERNFRLLKDRALPRRERLQALLFLIHFAGDLHQPLHAGDRGDLGGNRFRAYYSRIQSNLHAIWDGYLAERSISTPPADAHGLLSAFGRDERRGMAQGSVEDWARESWEVSRRFAYGGVLADPCGEVLSEPPVISQEQIRDLIPVVRTQITRGGLRLARLLDEALG